MRHGQICLKPKKWLANINTNEDTNLNKSDYLVSMLPYSFKSLHIHT